MDDSGQPRMASTRPKLVRSVLAVAIVGSAAFLLIVGYTTTHEFEAMTGATRSRYRWLGLEWAVEDRDSPALRWASEPLSERGPERWLFVGTRHHSIGGPFTGCGSIGCPVPWLYALDLDEPTKLDLLAEYQRDVMRAETIEELRGVCSEWSDRIASIVEADVTAK
jgi:hypothetical protein